MAQIAGLESRLRRFLVSLQQSGGEVPPLSRSYHRQYVGFVKDGQRFIYGSFYPSDTRLSMDEQRSPIIVCDGGPAFWGIVYGVDGHQFEEPRMNGYL
jgi:hypothetical protein